jgi:hypothetical protein
MSGGEVVDHAILLPYNGTEAQGADPREFDVNLWYEVSWHATSFTSYLY